MATTIVMPQMGYDMREGTVVRWRKQEGDPVSRGEVIAEIETDKAVVEMEAYATGVLRKIVVEEGKVVPVGETIAIIAQPDEPLPALEALIEEAAAPAPPLAEVLPAPPPTVEGVKATPIARRLAREKGIDLRQVKGSGPGGRITEADVVAIEATAPQAVAGRVELSRMRQAIARRTSQSKREIPHFYVTVEVDMTAALEARSQLNRALKEEGRISINDLIVKAVALALAKYPTLNATFREDHLQLNPSVNIGIVIALEQGLIAPAIPDCQAKSLVEIARASKDLIERAEKGVLRPEEYAGGTFSISNLGMFDVESFIAVILPPQVAMLALGSVRPQPVVKGGEVAVAQTMKATISVDHRATDGVEASRFLSEFKRLLEQPVSLLL